MKGSFSVPLTGTLCLWLSISALTFGVCFGYVWLVLSHGSFEVGKVVLRWLLAHGSTIVSLGARLGFGVVVGASIATAGLLAGLSVGGLMWLLGRAAKAWRGRVRARRRIVREPLVIQLPPPAVVLKK